MKFDFIQRQIQRLRSRPLVASSDITRIMAFVGILAVASTAMAHPGHGVHSENAWLHFLTTPQHLLPALLMPGLGLLLTWGWIHIRKSTSERVPK